MYVRTNTIRIGIKYNSRRLYCNIVCIMPPRSAVLSLSVYVHLCIRFILSKSVVFLHHPKRDFVPLRYAHCVPYSFVMSYFITIRTLPVPSRIVSHCTRARCARKVRFDTIRHYFVFRNDWKL
jgi:hypothetical protein